MNAVFEKKKESYTRLFIPVVGEWAQLFLGSRSSIGMNRRTLSKRDAVGARIRIWAGDLLYSERKAA